MPFATAGMVSDRASDADGANNDKSKSKTGNEISLLDEVDSIFDCLDKNGDGEITPDELRGHLVDEMGYTTDYTRYLFESIDTDSDGTISREELGFAFYNFEALSLYMTMGLGGADLTSRPSFQKLLMKQGYDNNCDDGGDGVGVGRDKLVLDDLADLVFDLIDADGSGEITRDELKEHFTEVTDRLSSKGGAGAGTTATVQQANEYVSTMFETLDANKDGTICREEIRSAFETYDFKLLARTFGLRVYQS